MYAVLACVALSLLAGLAGVGEATHYNHPTHAARYGAHAVSLGDSSQQPKHESGTAGAASFEGQKQCKCVTDGKCTCKGTCNCENCVGEHTEAQLRGKEQPQHPRPAVTGI